MMKAILTLVAASLAATALAVSASAAERTSPGATEMASAAQSEPYVPFVTDFPEQHPESAGPGLAADPSGGLDGLDAALGAAVGLVLGALAAASLPALRRRSSTA